MVCKAGFREALLLPEPEAELDKGAGMEGGSGWPVLCCQRVGRGDRIRMLA